ncbi:zinc finger protein 2-like [Archocentrus centrarchus]|uniref:zinc finger protein 2-like n=1 Tax=Archocentrus centrarchus TaxID=63155 RepID=UPI0011EA50E8|nr:zinc finger protein 2-like [Archocentrus centrarchus]
MAKMEALRMLVTERLTEAAEEITERLLHTPEMSPEQQGAVIRKRLSVLADEIFRILEIMIGGCEAEASRCLRESEHQCKQLNITLENETHSHQTDKLLLFGSSCEKNISSEHQKYDQRRSFSPPLKDPDPPQIKDLHTQTDSEFISSKPSQFRQTQRAAEGTSATMETDKEGEHSGVPAADLKVLSAKNPKAGSESKDVNEEQLKSNKRTLRAGSHGTDVYKMRGRSHHKCAAGKKMKNHLERTTTTNKSQNTGNSCCRVCGKFFRYRRSFLKHALRHEKSADLCGVCGKHLDSDESLKFHLKTHSEENGCWDQTDGKQSETECSDAESRAGESDEDWKKSEGSDSEESDKGDSKQKSKRKHKGHKNRDLSHQKYCCKVCGKFFCYRASFLKHVQEDERDADLCGMCGKHFQTKESLKLHLQTYIRTNDCEVCGKHFEGHKQLEMHMRTHTGEKPFVCTVCGKAFAQNGNLMGHMRAHTGEKPYVCSVCSQSFSFKEYMRAHMRIHTGEKPFLCSVCGKGFRQRGTLKTHMMIHTGESTHQCKICNKKFYKSGALKIHMRSHTGEKPYLCNVCGKSFTAGGSLTKHMGVHEGERTHRCSACGKTFQRKDELKRHVETHRDESIQLMSL